VAIVERKRKEDNGVFSELLLEVFFDFCLEGAHNVWKLIGEVMPLLRVLK
jgi:hypothetical protein